MDRLTSFLGSIKPHADGDFADKLNSFYTIIILVISAVVVSGWSFVGSPIQCWFPAYFKGWWIQYSLDYCYVQNTYFVPFTNKTPAKNYWDLINHPVDLPATIEERENRLIGYYQWVPFIFALIALCFYFPTAVWRSLNNHSGISLNTICTMTTILNHVDVGPRKVNTCRVARLLDHSKILSEELHGKTLTNGNYVSTLYLIVKGLYLFNAVAQFLLLQVFLGVKDNLWGLRVSNNLLNGDPWEETGHFPRVTICDFEVRELGNLHRHSVQCVLMVNMFNEKLFLFFWWWFLILIVINIISYISWILVVLVEPLNVRLVRNYLNSINHPMISSKQVELNMREFIRNCLKADGAFILRLVCCNAGDAVCRDMLECLWLQYFTRKHGKAPLAASESATATAPYEDSSQRDLNSHSDQEFSDHEEKADRHLEAQENALESTF